MNNCYYPSVLNKGRVIERVAHFRPQRSQRGGVGEGLFVRRRGRGLATGWFWIFFACLLCVIGREVRAATLPAGFSEATINGPAGGDWNAPVGMRFEDNGRMYVWEKGGRVWFQEYGASTWTLLIDLSEEMGDWADFGLLGFALDPDFRVNGYLYLMYVVDRHHLMNFGTPGYDPAANDYNSATIGRITRYTARAADGFTSVDYTTRHVLLGETQSNGFPILYNSHGVGSLVFGEDGTLLASCGDAASYLGTDLGSASETYYVQALTDGIIQSKENVGAYRSQLVDSLSGKIVRIDPATGDGIPSNPFYDAANPRAAKSRVWALGVRNPCRMTLRPGTGSHNRADANPGVLYIGDVGMYIWEDLNVCTGPGQNFGWPAFEGIDVHSDYYSANVQNLDAPNPLYPGSGCSPYFYFNKLIKQNTSVAANQPPFNNPCNTSQKIPNTIAQFLQTPPALDWKHGTTLARTWIYNGSGVATAINVGAAGSPVSGSTFPGNCSIGGVWYTGNDFPAQYKDTYFHADYGEGWIKNFVFNTNNKPVSVTDFVSGGGGIVAVATHPIDGGLYYIDITSPALRKITYSVNGNLPPMAVAAADQNYGPGPLSVQFTGNGSTDPEGLPLTYNWNFGDGTPASTTNNPSHIFNASPGVPTKYTVTLTVTDNVAQTSTTTLIISVNNTPPTVTITSPVDGSKYSMASNTVYNLTATVTDVESTDSQLKYEWKLFFHHNNHEHQSPIDTNHVTTSVITPAGCDGINIYYYRIQLTVTDPAGLATTREVKIFPDCGTPDTAPVISNIPDQTISQDQSTGPIVFSVSDAETAAANLQLSASSSNPTLVSKGNIIFGDNGISRTVTVTPAVGQTGTATITVTVNDGPNNTSTNFVLTVLPGPLGITTTTLPNGTTNAPYAATLIASGGTQPYSWSLVSGSLPAGLTLNTNNGAITGTPTTAGTSNFTAGLSDSSGPVQSVTKALSIVITPVSSVVSIWPSTAVPGQVDGGPDLAVELGVKFRSDVAGMVTGIRFYKATANTGTHVGHLWTGNGTLLATVTFTGETASGWQQMNFTNSVAIASNTVYVISYHVNAGHYSGDVNYFASSGVDNPPLHALANGVSGGNGVYAYGASSGFPSLTYKSANYWVDVSFQPSATPTLTSIAVTPANPNITSGASQPFTATGTYSDGSTENLTSQGVWSSSSPGVATINGSGLATSVSVGGTTITATLGSVSGNTTLTVQPPPVSITTSSLPGGTVGVVYSATLTGSGGTPPYTWSLASGSLPAGLTLNMNNGAITGTPTTAGTSNFTAGLSDSSGPVQNVTKALSIVVTPTLSSIAVAPVNPSITSGASQPFTATGTYSDGSTQNVTSQVVWTSSNTAVATINPSGLAKGVSAGSTTISAALAGKSGNSTLTIQPAPVTITTASLPSGTVSTSYTTTLTASGGTAPYSWSIIGGSLPAGLTLNTTSGAITGTPTTAGTFNFTAQVGDFSNPIQTATKPLSITVAPVLTSIAVTPANPSIFPGATQQFTATGTYSDSSTQNITSQATWISSNTAVATINASGLASGISAGTTTVAAALAGKTGSTTLTILPAPVGLRDYRSVSSGVWTNAAIWQTNNGTAWVAASRPPTNNTTAGVITIRNGHTVTATASVKVDQVVVEASGQITLNSGVTLTLANGAGIDLEVFGTFQNAGTITINSGATINFQSGGTYQHNRNAGTIPTATWAATSTCLITGITSTLPGGLAQTFGQFTWNCAGQSGDFNLETSMNIAGNFTVSATGSKTLRLSNSTTARTMTVGGNYNQTGGTFNLKNSSGTASLNVAGNFIQTGGTFTLRSGSATGSGTVTVTGNYNLSAGTFNLSSVGAVGTLKVGGNFSHTGGTITETSTGSGAIIFTSGVHTNISGGTVASTINFTVNTGATLMMGTSLLGNGSSGTFTLSSGGTLGIGDPAGITTSGATGNIRVTGTRTFNTGANYIYNGTAAQVPGSGLPATVNDLTIANAAGLTMNGTNTVNGACTVNPGARLLGTGRINNGPVILSGTVAPGASVGRFTTARETWNGGAGYNWEINNASGAPGTGWDLLSGQGIDLQATTQNPFTLKLITLNGSSPGLAANFNKTNTYTWTIAITTNATVTNFATDKFVIDTTQFSNDWGVGTFSVEQSGSDLRLMFTSEPSELAIVTTTLPNGVQNVAYTATLAASSGATPYTWSIAGGSLPSGLALNTNSGAMTGTPTAAGTFNFTAQVSDASNPVKTATKSLAITIAPALTSIAVTPANPAISVGSTQQFTATGIYSDGSTQSITSQATWVSSNPAVATINASGLATGAATGNTTISAALSGVSGNTTLTVQAAPVAITTTSLPNGTVSVAYSATLTASGGTTPYTWSLASGSLPTGLTLNTNSGAISGTPTAPGTSNFTAQVSDSSSPVQSATRALSIIVTSVPTTVGNTNEGTLIDSIGASWINAGRFQAGASLTAVTMYAKVVAIPGKYKCAIYSESGGQPSRLLRSSAEISNPVTGWQAFPLTSSLALTNGQFYWLAIWSDNDNAKIYYSDTAGTIRWGNYNYGTWPDPIATPAGGSASYCIYATGTAAMRASMASMAVTPVNQPTILSVGMTDGVVTITCSAVAGRTYVLEYVDNLGDTNWVRVLPPVLATDPTVTVTNSVGDASRRFYRIVNLAY